MAESEIKPWRYPPKLDFLYGEWLRREFERGNLEPGRPRANCDLVTLIAMVLRGKTPLFGPAPAEVFGPISSR